MNDMESFASIDESGSVVSYGGTGLEVFQMPDNRQAMIIPPGYTGTVYSNDVQTVLERKQQAEAAENARLRAMSVADLIAEYDSRMRMQLIQRLSDVEAAVDRMVDNNMSAMVLAALGFERDTFSPHKITLNTKKSSLVVDLVKNRGEDLIRNAVEKVLAEIESDPVLHEEVQTAVRKSLRPDQYGLSRMLDKEMSDLMDRLKKQAMASFEEPWLKEIQDAALVSERLLESP